MLFKVFCLTFNSAQGTFDDGPIRDFLKDKEIIAINDHLFMRNEIPYLTVIVKYYPYRAEADSKPKAESGREGTREEEWRSLLSESDMGLFNLLRDWRSERCKKDGVPPYVLFTNMQLAAIVKKRPQSAAELGKIEGIGPGKLQKYSDDVLKITKIQDVENNIEQNEPAVGDTDERKQ